MTDTPHLRVALWLAVSSKPQADRYSLTDQEQLGREFAAALDATITATYTVPGHTRDIILWNEAEEQMPAYRHLREDCTAGSFDVLWALDMDRLGRDPALSNTAYSLVTRAGAEVYLHTAPHPIGQQTTSHRYLPAFQSVRAAEDQQRRVHHHRAGMKARVVKRGLIGNNPPWCLDPIRDPATGATIRYQPNHHAPAVQLMTDLFLAGHNYNEIRRRLDASAYTPPHTPHWPYSLIRRTLNSDVLAGLPSWGGHQPDQPSPHIVPLWDPQTFAAIVRERRRRARRPYTRTGASPLSGVAICARCGKAMSRYKSRNTYYLRCPTRAHAAITGKTCHKNNLPETRALDALADHLRTLADPAALDRALATLGTDRDQQQLQRNLDRATAAAADLEQQRHRLALALAAGKMQPDIYANADRQLQDQLHAEQTRAADLQRQLEALPDLQQKKAALAALATAFPDLLQHAEPAELSQLLQSAGIVITCDSGAVLSITP